MLNFNLSSRLYTAFIDFKQAYDSTPRSKLWEHLQRCQMPRQILAILKDLYHDDLEWRQDSKCAAIIWLKQSALSLPCSFQST